MAEQSESCEITLNRLSNLADKLQPVDDEPSSGREPDSDAIKMFVGQIPRDWDETNCRNLLEEYGDIHSLNILRDKKTAVSRGCCFVTYYTRRAALKAQDALHNIRILQGMHHPVQMKPADSENRNERKLFVGMLSRKFNENEVRSLFSQFGNIEECIILRDSNGLSKGCAFVTFASRSNALNAIKTMNHSLTLEDCTSPVVVKFADTQKEKDTRKQQQQLVRQIYAAAGSPINNYAQAWALERSPSNVPVSQIFFDGSPSFMTLTAANATSQPQQQQQQQIAAAAAASLALKQQLASDPISITAAMLAAALCGQTANGSSSNGLQSAALNGTNPLSSLNLGQHSFTASLPSINNLSKFVNSTPSQLALTCAQTSKPMQGPEGSNLFIYHLPPEYTDIDLAQTFASFGNIISSKVFIDKITNLSKCFGFVSFDNPLSAQTAIQAMNGFQIGSKRLKVQLKKIKDKPY
ncbi:CUGBP Elav-like family member 2 isoform X2 [Brevipalpus obovatus]|uniref:CUGBP Elav-like family member 2 isoform X2 n=1 Tax=Brevipalpus obovatus TaxID=246614 RepID=UPI003D9FACE9